MFFYNSLKVKYLSYSKATLHQRSKKNLFSFFSVCGGLLSFSSSKSSQEDNNHKANQFIGPQQLRRTKWKAEHQHKKQTRREWRKPTWGTIGQHVYLCSRVYTTKNSSLHIPINIIALVTSTVPDLINQDGPLLKTCWEV